MNSYYKKILMIAIPIALQNLMTMGISLIDSFSVGSIGEAELTAVAQAGQIFMILSISMFGMTSGSNVLIAQYWGKKDVRSIRQVMGYSIKIMIMLSLTLTFVCYFFSVQIMSTLSNQQALIELGSSYLKTVCLSYLLYGITTVIGGMLRGVGTVRITMAASFISICASLFFNWYFVFGDVGLKLGVIGSAYANILARIFEVSIILIYVFFFEKKVNFRSKEILYIDKEIKKSYISNCLPVIANEMVWVFGFSALTMIAGHMPAVFTTSYSIFTVIGQMSNVMGQGVAIASAIQIGTIIGAGQLDKLPEETKRLKRIAFCVGVLAATFILVMIPFIPHLYNITNETYKVVISFMLVGCVIEVFRNTGYTINLGILRGAGDAKFVFFVDVFFLWTVGVGLGYLCGVVLKLPLPFVFLLLRGDDIIKCIGGYFRVKYGNWVHQVTKIYPELL